MSFLVASSWILVIPVLRQHWGASLPEDPVHGGVVFERGQGHSRALLVIPMAPSPPGGTTEGSEGACEALLLPTMHLWQLMALLGLAMAGAN